MKWSPLLITVTFGKEFGTNSVIDVKLIASHINFSNSFEEVFWLCVVLQNRMGKGFRWWWFRKLHMHNYVLVSYNSITSIMYVSIFFFFLIAIVYNMMHYIHIWDSARNIIKVHNFMVKFICKESEDASSPKIECSIFQLFIFTLLEVRYKITLTCESISLFVAYLGSFRVKSPLLIWIRVKCKSSHIIWDK